MDKSIIKWLRGLAVGALTIFFLTGMLCLTAHAEILWNAVKHANPTDADYPYPRISPKTISLTNGSTMTASGEWWTEVVIINAGCTIFVAPYDGSAINVSTGLANNGTGHLIIHAKQFLIAGTISAEGIGYGGGTGGTGGAGGTGGIGGSYGRFQDTDTGGWYFSFYNGRNGEGGRSGSYGTVGAGSWPGIIYPYLSSGGSGGSGGTSTYGNLTYPTAGTGGFGSITLNPLGIYRVQFNGGYSNYGVNDEDQSRSNNNMAFMGSGGAGGNGGPGGGGGGGGGGFLGSGYQKHDGTSGGAGGNGGNGGIGGKGGGVIKLFAEDSITIESTGLINTRGAKGSAVMGVAGAKGTDNTANAPGGAGGAANSGTGGTGTVFYSTGSLWFKWTSGGGGGGGSIGGDGGGGAGGGVVIRCDRADGIRINGKIDARGADCAAYPGGNTYGAPDSVVVNNGGTVKIFYGGTKPSTTSIAAANPLGYAESEKIFLYDMSPAIPTMFVNPSTLAFSAKLGGGNPATQTISISNSGGGTLAWSVSDDASWLTLNPTSGTVVSETDNVTVSVSTTGLSEGTYTAAITVSGTGVTSQTISVTLTIGDLVGTIRVKTYQKNPSTGAVTDLSNVPFNINGPSNSGSYLTDPNGNWSVNDAVLGGYNITFGAMAGYANPPLFSPAANAVLNSGDTLTFIATYEVSDTDPPTPAPILNLPQVDANGKVTFSWSPSTDTGSGMKYYSLLINDALWYCGTDASCTVDKMDDGTYPLVVRATDNAGNSTDSSVLNYLHNFAAPEVLIKIDGRTYTAQPGDGGALAVSIGSTIQLEASDNNGLSKSSMILVDKAGATVMGPNAVFNINKSAALKDKEIYTVIASAEDTGGKSTTVTLTIQVFSGGAEVINGNPLNYPNPFEPSAGTTIKYYLSANAETKVLIYDMTGKLVWQKKCRSGSTGGQINLNEVLWDGKDNFGSRIAFGPYYYFIVSDGKVIGKGEMAAFK